MRMANLVTDGTASLTKAPYAVGRPHWVNMGRRVARACPTGEEFIRNLI